MTRKKKPKFSIGDEVIIAEKYFFGSKNTNNFHGIITSISKLMDIDVYAVRLYNQHKTTFYLCEYELSLAFNRQKCFNDLWFNNKGII